jgi:hypothetical protein
MPNPMDHRATANDRSTDQISPETPALDAVNSNERNTASLESDSIPPPQIPSSIEDSSQNRNCSPTEDYPAVDGNQSTAEENVDESPAIHDHSAETSTIGSDNNIFTPPEEVVTLDPHGDIRLIVSHPEDGQVTFVASSSCLRLASATWSALLESTTSEDAQSHIETELSGNDIETTRTILQIAHLHFDKVPTSLSFEQLLKVAIFCDKHETAGLVRPFLKSWAWPWASKILVDGYEQWLFIAWVFGFEETFEAITHSLAVTIKTNPEGECLIPGGVLSGSHIPGTIIGW